MLLSKFIFLGANLFIMHMHVRLGMHSSVTKAQVTQDLNPQGHLGFTEFYSFA